MSSKSGVHGSEGATEAVMSCECWLLGSGWTQAANPSQYNFALQQPLLPLYPLSLLCSSYPYILHNKLIKTFIRCVRIVTISSLNMCMLPSRARNGQTNNFTIKQRLMLGFLQYCV